MSGLLWLMFGLGFGAGFSAAVFFAGFMIRAARREGGGYQ